MPEHYGTVAGADSYHAARGATAWTGDDAAKTAALVRASQYLDAAYVWPGQVADVDQALEWPRSGVTWRAQGVADDTVPLPVIHATYEAALRELTAPGSLAPDHDPTGVVKSRSEEVGPIKESVEYVEASGSGQPRFALIDGILRGLLGRAPGAVNFALSRA